LAEKPEWVKAERLVYRRRIVPMFCLAGIARILNNDCDGPIRVIPPVNLQVLLQHCRA